MREIDEIRIRASTGKFVLVIHDTEGGRAEYAVGLPDQVYEEVARTLGVWVHDRATTASGPPRNPEQIVAEMAGDAV